MIHAGGHVPVDGADVVTDLVFPDLLELHAAALEGADIFPGHEVVDKMVGPQMDGPDACDDLRTQTCKPLLPDRLERKVPGGASPPSPESLEEARPVDRAASCVFRAHGTSTLDRIRWMISSVSSSSASASYDRMIRCRSTSGAMVLMSCGVTNPRPARNAKALAASTR